MYAPSVRTVRNCLLESKMPMIFTMATIVASPKLPFSKNRPFLTFRPVKIRNKGNRQLIYRQITYEVSLESISAKLTKLNKKTKFVL